MMASLYIHIPFCRSRCIYCDFCSTTLSTAWQLPYVEALGREMALRKEERAAGTEASTACPTLYVGGGTPSLLTAKAQDRLFRLLEENFPLAEGAEVTLEANPDDVTPEWVARLKDTPVGRVSMGVQSLDDAVLRTLRRRHTAGQARRAVELLQRSGYGNLSLDLIYGLPGQQLQQFEADVREVLAMGVQHLSAYALQFEEGTPLARMKAEGIVHEADEELSLRCYQRLIDQTQAYGMEHYEISNFARPGYRARHNSAYWSGAPYMGLGAGAHSYDGQRTRTANAGNVEAYMAALAQGNPPPRTTETLTEAERYNERVMLRLRTREGLSLTALERDFGPERRRYCERMAAPHLRRGTLQVSTASPASGTNKKAGEALCLTRQGLFVSDDIISDLFS